MNLQCLNLAGQRLQDILGMEADNYIFGQEHSQSRFLMIFRQFYVK